MQRFRDNILIMGSNGLIPYSGSSVAVYVAGTSTLASIYPNNDPAGAKENPFRAGDYGEIDFYAQNGRYDLLLSRQGYQSLRITDLQIWDPANSDFVTDVDVDGMIAGKADKTYVDSELLGKADITYVDQEVAGLIDDVTPAEDKTYSSQKVSTDLAEKVNTVDLADDTDPDAGANIVGYRGRTAKGKLDDLVSVEDYGGTTTQKFQAAIDALPSQGGSVVVPEGDFSDLVPGLLVTGMKAVTWLADKATVPEDTPGVVVRSGVFTLPTAHGQSDRSVRVHQLLDAGATQASPTTRQYVQHVSGFMPDTGQVSGECEFRAFSFDIGTDTSYNQADIRGMKGRVYADGGNGNIRAIYGVANGFNGHTGDLTGLIGTVIRDATSSGHAVAVRGHIQLGSPGSAAAFQAAGNGGPVEANGYSIRGGSGNPLLPRDFGFESHGGGTGDMYRGLKSHTDTTVTYRVRNDATVMGQGFYSGSQTIVDDAAISFTPPRAGGFIRVWANEVNGGWGEVFFRANAAPFANLVNGGTIFSNANIPLTGTTGDDTKITVSAANDGKIYIENRTGAPRRFGWLFSTD